MTAQQTNMAGVEITDRGPWIGTYTRQKFYPLDPREEEIYIEDIAACLSKLCRFNGHIDRVYTVAEHSVHMARVAGKDVNLARWCLLHDATEAYIGDMVRPLKAVIPKFAEIENNLMKVIAKRFNLGPEPAMLHVIDNRMCSTEKRDLIEGSEPWENMPIAFQSIFIPEEERTSSEIYAEFMFQFHRLFPEEPR